jgi:hypothetical protein
MHRRLRILLLVCALATQAACAKDFGVSTSFDPLTRFPAAATFAWDEAKSSLPEDPRLQELDLGPVIREVAAESFATHGYTETSGASHYLLSYHLDVKTWHSRERSEAVGTLAFQLVERKSRRLVWSGFARADVKVGRSEQERRVRLGAIVTEMLEDFPPS